MRALEAAQLNNLGFDIEAMGVTDAGYPDRCFTRNQFLLHLHRLHGEPHGVVEKIAQMTTFAIRQGLLGTVAAQAIQLA